ncbi:MAG TPA: pyruvate synthase subunit beta, partial [Firmicutes bacterium]|nr:pyruvate synthase subunit beta [Bacillota bacterium]
YDNEAYMNTGIQRSGATPLGAWTTTTPAGKQEGKKDIVGMLLAQGIPYIATASAGYIEDFQRKVAKAKDTDGPAYLHVQTPCSTGWRFPARDTITVARLAVETGLWPLFEAVNGKVRVTHKVKEFKPLEEYLQRQGRFRNITPAQVARLKAAAQRYYADLLAKEAEA